MPRTPRAASDPDRTSLPAPADDDGPSASQVAEQAREQRSASRLAADVIGALSELATAVQARIAGAEVGPASLADEASGRAPHLTGLVYKMVRGVPRLADPTVDSLLRVLATLLAVPTTTAHSGLPQAEREAIAAALNGVLGNHLARMASPLTIGMTWRHAGRTLPMERETLARALPGAGRKLLVLIHDLCLNDLSWQRATVDRSKPAGESIHDHGAALRDALGFTPVYLHYDSGLHVSTNGRALASQLEQLLHEWPQPIERFAALGHGMGGLLARSALHYATAAAHHWPHRLDDLVFLGTPHHGTIAGRGPVGQGLAGLLAGTPSREPLARLMALRSPGITDLQHGNLLDDDWRAGDRLARATDRRIAVPLPAGPRFHAIGASAASTQPDAAGTQDQPAGDGLVPLASALGRHRIARRTLKFLPDRQRTFERTSHLDLLSSPAVFEQLRRWLDH